MSEPDLEAPRDVTGRGDPALIPEMAPPFLRRGAAPRPQISPTQARRIDRLARRAHRFHRFAHHPLCGRYAGEVIRIGRRARVCRGCAFAAIGGAIGGAAGLAMPASSTIAVIAAGAAIALLLPSLASARRWPKLLTRLAPAALFAFAIVAGLLAHGWLVAAGVLAVVVTLRLAYGRRGGDRSPCATCPERALEPCSGFAPIVRREQAFQRAVRRLIVLDDQ